MGVLGSGDVNGDGFDDLFVGLPDIADGIVRVYSGPRMDSARSPT